jgi:hypothetical protein
VSHGLSHDVGAGSTNAVGVDVDLDDVDRPVPGELADHRECRPCRGGDVSAAVGGAEVRRVPSLNAQPSRRIMCLTLSA